MVMVLLIALTMLAPFVIVGVTIAENADRVGDTIRTLIENGPPDPPSWVVNLPFVGEYVGETWSRFAHDTASLLVEARNYIEPARKVLIASGTTVLGGILQLALSVFIAFFFFRDGDALIERAHAATRPHRRRARSPARVGRDDDRARRRHRHPRHGAGAGRADGDRALAWPASRRRRCWAS